MTELNYFYIDGNGAQQGPRTLEQLKATYVITPDTMMWRQGMDDWKKASEIEGLDEVLVQRPPVAPVITNVNANTSEPNQVDIPLNKPNSFLIENILTTLFCCFIFGAIGIYYAAKVDSLWISGQYAESRSASNTAKLMFIAALVSALVGIVGYLIFLGVIASTVGTL